MVPDNRIPTVSYSYISGNYGAIPRVLKERRKEGLGVGGAFE